MVELRELCDTIYSLYDLIRDREDINGNLEFNVTVDDPKPYTRPWTVQVKRRIMLDIELIQFICIDKDAPHYVSGK